MMWSIFIVRPSNGMDFDIPMRTHFWIMDYLPKKNESFSRCFFSSQVWELLKLIPSHKMDRSRSNNNNQCLASEPNHSKAYLVNMFIVIIIENYNVIAYCYYRKLINLFLFVLPTKKRIRSECKEKIRKHSSATCSAFIAHFILRL